MLYINKTGKYYESRDKSEFYQKMWSENKMYQKLISDYIVHKLHGKFRIHTICIYKETTELQLTISHTAAYRSTAQSNTNQNSSGIFIRGNLFLSSNYR